MQLTISRTVLQLCVMFAVVSAIPKATAQELNTVLMNGTFEVMGPSSKEPGKTTFGTVFFVGKPIKGEPGQASFVLITAAHVFNEISGNEATVLLRKKDPSGIYSNTPYALTIRRNGTNLYTTNPDADVAAMYAALPKDTEIMLIDMNALVDDATLEEWDVHPGDELLCLGYPLAVSENTFSVIRNGLLASYPITPSKNAKQYFYNFHIFPGNSGGPVYFSFSNKVVRGGTRIGLKQGIIGLVSQQATSNLPEFKDATLDIAIVVPRSYIRDTIALLPEQP